MTFSLEREISFFFISFAFFLLTTAAGETKAQEEDSKNDKIATFIATANIRTENYAYRCCLWIEILCRTCK